MTITPNRLDDLDTLVLKHGSHTTRERGMCFNEAAAWLAGEKHGDRPSCVSPVLRSYTMTLNDRWDDTRRQSLKQYVPLVVGTANDGKDARRQEIAAEFLATRLMPDWLHLAGMAAQAITLEGKTGSELRSALYKIRDNAWTIRQTKYTELRTKIREQLQAKMPADVAVAAAVAVAVAHKTFAYGSESYWAVWNAVSAAVREHLKTSPALAQVRELSSKQQPMALDLLELLIDAA